jgi:hypothetical protein
VSESRDFIDQQLTGDRAASVAPSSEQQSYLEGAPSGEDQVDGQDDGQDDGQESGETIELPDEWPSEFWNALTPAAQAEFERGDHDLVEEYGAWIRGEVDDGSPEPVVPSVELPMSADDVAEQVRLWTDVAQAGGDGTTSAEEALAYADAYRLQARATAIAEVHAGRRQSWDLSPEDQRDVLQAEIDRRVAAGREKWGNR